MTCPAALERFARDAAIAGVNLPLRVSIGFNGQAAVSSAQVLGTASNEVVFEEFAFRVAGDASAAAAILAEAAIADPATRARFKNHLAILPDDDFNHFVRHATEVVARVGLNYETKTVRDGALFYQEFLPPETLFYSVVIAAASRNGNPKTAKEILAYVRDRLNGGGRMAVIQIGGDEDDWQGTLRSELVERGVAMAKTMDQKRAAHAYEAARQGAGAEDFRTMVKKLPVLIRTCGLGHAVAFLVAKNKAAALSGALDTWIATAIPGQGKLLDRIVKEDSDFLQRATDESLAYLVWLVRFTEAEEKAKKAK